MGYGPPPGLTDPDELDKHYAMAVKLAPIHCFHCMELGHMKPACPLLNLENSWRILKLADRKQLSLLECG